jgi:membrane fusion protein, multidrug efflux system
MRYSFPVVSISILLILLFTACSGSSGDSAEPNRPAVRVEVTSVRTQSLAMRLSSSGTISAKNEVKVTAQTDGKVEVLNVEEGDVVREGQVLIQLDATIPHAQYREAEANLQEARLNYERAEQLYERSLISNQEYQTLRTRHQIAESRYEYQKAILEYTTIRAPISGVITYRGIDRGDIALTREHVLTITSFDKLVILVNVSELDVPHINVGDDVNILVDAIRGGEFTGKVRRIFPSANPDTRLVPIEVELLSGDERLFPGMFARAEFKTERRENALVIPANGLLTSPRGGNYVFVVNDSVAHYREVVPGLRTDRYVEVLEGLSESDKIVVIGAGALTDGMRVQVTAEREAL